MKKKTVNKNLMVRTDNFINLKPEIICEPDDYQNGWNQAQLLAWRRQRDRLNKMGSKKLSPEIRDRVIKDIDIVLNTHNI